MSNSKKGLNVSSWQRSYLKKRSTYPWELKFPGESESAFRKDQIEQSILQLKLCSVILLVCCIAFGIQDYLVFKQTAITCWIGRYLICTPVIIANIIMFSYSKLKKYFYLSCCATLSIITITIQLHMIVKNSLGLLGGNYIYFLTLMMVLIGFCVCYRLPFIYSVLTSLFILGSFVITTLVFIFPSLQELHILLGLIHLSILMAIASFISYQLELKSRKNYLQVLIIDEDRELIEKIKYEREKEQIVKKLHDGIGGVITNIKLMSEIQAIKSEIGSSASAFTAIAELSDGCLTELRTFADVLDQKYSSWKDMFADMRFFAKNMLECHGIAINFSADASNSLEEPETLSAINLMNIYKEAIANIIKHSKAESVDISFEINDKWLRMSVKDDGEWQHNESISGRGMKNMQSRAVDLSGALTITHDKNTNVFLEVPLRQMSQELSYC
ncbi:MAG: hypothetical protein C0403_17715 [Desulfobacterium sp.]|nr:hypothetical protein [Desulfobacterium sp.]